MRTRIAGFGRRLARTVALIGLMVTVHAQAQEANAPRSDSLAHYFPSRDLVAYAEFDGVDAHGADWEKTAAYRVLTETTTGAMLEQSAARLLDLVLSGRSGAAVGGRDLVALGKHLLRSGCAVGMNRAGGVGPPHCLAVVIRGAASGKALGRRSAVASRRASSCPDQYGREAGWPKSPGSGRSAAGRQGVVDRGG